jgi:phage-related tail fiber protein
VPTPTYFAIFTTLGLTRLADAQATATPLVFSHVAVGDGNGSPITPVASMTALVNERARVATNSVGISPDEPDIVRVEGLIPAGTGGFTIREAGLFDLAGELMAVASYPPIYKPTPADGATVDEYIRILLQYTAVTAIALTIDPNVIMATRLYVDDATAGRLWLLENFT